LSRRPASTHCPLLGDGGTLHGNCRTAADGNRAAPSPRNIGRTAPASIDWYSTCRSGSHLRLPVCQMEGPRGTCIITSAMIITVNGNPREVSDQTTILRLLDTFQLKPQSVAVELNRRLLKSDKYGEILKEGDQVEIVTFVGGG